MFEVLKHSTVVSIRRHPLFDIKTMYLFACNYNVIILVWATIGTICAKRSTNYNPANAPILNETRNNTGSTESHLSSSFQPSSCTWTR
jgi:hypothetical protein